MEVDAGGQTMRGDPVISRGNIIHSVDPFSSTASRTALSYRLAQEPTATAQEAAAWASTVRDEDFFEYVKLKHYMLPMADNRTFDELYEDLANGTHYWPRSPMPTPMAPPPPEPPVPPMPPPSRPPPH